MMKPSTLFSVRLKEARLRYGISQRRLGLEAGLDASGAGVRMNQYENGSHWPKFTTTVEIARVLNVPPSYFFEPDSDMADLILVLGSLDSHDRRQVSDFASRLSTSIDI